MADPKRAKPKPGPPPEAIDTETETTTTPPPDDYKAAHYSASINAWFGTKMEKDKSLLTLASAGVGFLVSLGANSRTERTLFIISSFSFVITIFCAITIFEINAKLIEAVIRGDRSSTQVGKLATNLDYVLVGTFLLGVTSLAVLGVARFMGW